jgi:murein L,D-transpeptidase YcbB/YkuD
MRREFGSGMTKPFLVAATLAALAGTARAQPQAQPLPQLQPQAPLTTGAPAPARPLLPATPAPVVLDSAVKAAVDAGLDEQVRRFYAARSYAKAWSRADAAVLLAAVQDADRHALNPRDFTPDVDSVRDPAERDVRLTRAALAYASALAMGRVNPELVEPIFTLRRNVVDVPAGLNGALKAGRLRDWLAGLAPTDKGYQGLSNFYLKYRSLAIAGGWPAFVPGAPIKPGDDDKRIPVIVARLAAEGDLDPAVAATLTGTLYGAPVVQAMQKFQARHGLEADGVVGEDTQDELAATAEDRARQIATNMERRRWLARVAAPERIDVNTAAAIMVYWKDGQPVRGQRVINGKAKTQTPSIEASFSTVLANPPWNVPQSIIQKEILPREAREPGYIAKSDMISSSDAAGVVRVVQRPGPNNSLGAVKFEVQDPYAIYLHDTPTKKLFAHYQRHLSHGCVRVENAIEFARFLLKDDPAGLATFDAAQASGETTRVSIGRDIPVRLVYWTAFMTGDDKVAFRKDVYGHDSKLGEALGVGALSFTGADRDKTEDVGP